MKLSVVWSRVVFLLEMTGRSQRRKGEEVILSQAKVLWPSLEKGQKVPGAAESRGNSSHLTCLVIRQLFFFFKDVMKVSLRETGKVKGDGTIDRREETRQIAAKSLGLHQPLSILKMK